MTTFLQIFLLITMAILLIGVIGEKDETHREQCAKCFVAATVALLVAYIGGCL
jgi:hypothetical protein